MMTPTDSSTTPTLEGAAGPSIEAIKVGDTVLVWVDLTLVRPMIVTSLQPEKRISGTLFCEPDDHTRPVFRGAIDRRNDPARIEGRPSANYPVGYGKSLQEGTGLGNWSRR
jgi:hypothetical protein